MKIGFTGTRSGMSLLQYAFMKKAIKHIKCFKNCEAHHGACIGADEQFHEIVTELGIDVWMHPGVNSQGKCFSRGVCHGAKKVLPEKPFLMRDKDIVDSVDIMFATPKQNKEQLRSGTWATIRYAKKRGKWLIIVFPDGSVGEFNNEFNN